MKDDGTHMVLGVKDGVQQFISVLRPKIPPADCGMSNEDLECLGCGTKLGCVKPGHCYAVEGEAALKGR